jgi:hypothetical protein
MTLRSPITIATINGVSVRFFRSPQQGYDFPWSCFTDLMEAAKLKEEHQLFFLRMVRNTHGNDTRVVPTSRGPVVLAPHFMAQGAIHAMEELGFVSSKFEDEYCHGLAEAVSAVVAHLPPVARFDAAIAMAQRQVGAEAGG